MTGDIPPLVTGTLQGLIATTVFLLALFVAHGEQRIPVIDLGEF